MLQHLQMSKCKQIGFFFFFFAKFTVFVINTTAKINMGVESSSSPLRKLRKELIQEPGGRSLSRDHGRMLLLVWAPWLTQFAFLAT